MDKIDKKDLFFSKKRMSVVLNYRKKWREYIELPSERVLISLGVKRRRIVERFFNKDNQEQK